MNILILGGDGYLGWPTAVYFASAGHKVTVVDNYLRRNMAAETGSLPLIDTPNLNQKSALYHALSNHRINVVIGDCTEYDFMRSVFREVAPDTVVHYAEQPSGPYSMRDYISARLTLDNNIQATLNVIWAVMEEAPDCHIIKLGTMGEYGTPNIDIEEGWIDIEHKGRSDRFLFPRQAGSLYHTTKVLDTDLLWFYVRTYGLRVTDLMQGPVYGVRYNEIDEEKLLPHFHYDDIFGTVVNRFVTQAVCGIPLTVYGQGGQTRGYLNLKDTLQCINLAATTPAKPHELRILNQFTETFTVNELAEITARVGNSLDLNVKVEHIDNPRKEAENHYYNPAHSGLTELGLKPNYLTDDVMADLLETVVRYKDRIDPAKVMPRVKWNTSKG